MDTPPTPPTPQAADPVAVLTSLNPDSIRARLDQIEAERGALRVLLRAATRRQTGNRNERTRG